MFYTSSLLISQAWGTHGTEKCMDSFGERPEEKRLLSRPRSRREAHTVLKSILKTG
jgi:hypothetical protein